MHENCSPYVKTVEIIFDFMNFQKNSHEIGDKFIDSSANHAF